MKYSHPKLFINEIKNINSFRNKDKQKFDSKNNQKPLTYKENTKQNHQFEVVFHNYKYNNKNKKNQTLHIEPIKSATIPSIKKIKSKNILSEENLINLMNKYINYSMKKNQNKKKLKNNLTNLNEENKDNDSIEDEKKLCMKSLIKKGIITEIKDLQKPKKETLKEKLTQKKKSFLEDIGIEPNNITSFQESNNSTNNNNNNNQNIHNINTNINTNNNNCNNCNNCNIKINYDINNNININNNYYKTFTGICSTKKRIKYFSPKSNYDLYLYEDESFSDKECRKTPLKPKINQFEYIRKIKKERSKIQTNPNYISMEPENSSKKKFLKILTPKIEITLNDSFRHKSKKLNKKINYTNYNSNRIKKFNNNKINLKIKKNSEINNDENIYTYKKNYRSPEELNKYMKNKKIKEKDNEDKKINKKNKELFLKYKNLCTLNNNYSYNNNCYRKFSPTYYNTISMKCKTHTSGFGLKDKRKIDDKIISNNENIKDNNSTLIDANEYYLNILESKKLIIKNLYSKTETQFYNKNKNNSNIQLKNLDEYFTKDNKNKNNIIINTNGNINNNNINLIKKNNDDKKEMIRKISKKINDTLIKAKKVFSIDDNDSIRNENEDNKKIININIDKDNKDNKR